MDLAEREPPPRPAHASERSHDADSLAPSVRSGGEAMQLQHPDELADGVDGSFQLVQVIAAATRCVNICRRRAAERQQDTSNYLGVIKSRSQ